jgi:Glutamine synthetase, catalytic domain
LTRGAWPSEEGLDGIQNKIDPGPAMEKDLYDPPPKELKKIPTVCGSLREALSSLDRDRAFLKAGDGFEMTPHPVEFEVYYSYCLSYCLARQRNRRLQRRPLLGRRFSKWEQRSGLDLGNERDPADRRRVPQRQSGPTWRAIDLT